MKRLNSAGFAAWEAILGVLIVVAIAVAGYRVYNSSTTSNTSPTSASTQATNAGAGSSTAVPAAPAINNAASLDQATAALNQVDPGSSNASDSNQLNSANNY